MCLLCWKILIITALIITDLNFMMAFFSNPGTSYRGDQNKHIKTAKPRNDNGNSSETPRRVSDDH